MSRPQRPDQAVTHLPIPLSEGNSGRGQGATIPAADPQTTTRHRILFGILCLVWGTTWIAMKTGTAHATPGLFSGIRWTLAGLILLGVRAAAGHSWRFPPRLLGRLLLIALLMVTLNQLTMMYGLRYVGSGLSGVINCATTPLFMLGLAIAAGQERATPRQLLAMAIGIGGILLLFGPQAVTGGLDRAELAGALLIVLGTLVYCVGSVLARPVMRTIPTVQVAGLTNLAGGLMLLAVAPFEPGFAQAATLRWGWAAWVSWAYMLGPAALGATTIFLILVRDWGASRAGTYAFVSPVVAVLVGVVLGGESVGAFQGLGMVLMLGSAVLALRKA